MENFGTIPLEKLHENAERIWKVLSQFPEGTTVRRLRQITSMKRTPVYDALKELKSKGFIVHESPIWKIKEKTSIEPESIQDVVYKPRVIDPEMLELYQNIEAVEEVADLIPEIKNDEQMKMLKSLKKVVGKLSGAE